MNVLLVNNYSMERAFDLWKKGISGSHHVWGKVELDQEGTVNMIVFPHEKHKWINKLGKFFGITHLDQQIRILFHLNSFDVLYAPYFLANLRLILFLKFLGIFNKPIVICVHQSFGKSKYNNLFTKSISKLILDQIEGAVFLSEPLYLKIMTNIGLDKDSYGDKFTTAQWGPDISYYERFCLTRIPFNSCEFFISAGHTDRDFETIIEAFRGLPYRLKIFCTPTSLPKTKDIPANVEVNWEVTYSKDLIPFYQKAIAILIPLKLPPNTDGCQGMTSIQDVLTFGKPTVITTNPCLNINVEEEGIGFNVAMNDVNRWKEKIILLATDKEIWEKMSQNSADLFLNKVNSKIFADHLGEVFEKVFAREKSMSKVYNL